MRASPGWSLAIAVGLFLTGCGDDRTTGTGATGGTAATGGSAGVGGTGGTGGDAGEPPGECPSPEVYHPGSGGCVSTEALGAKCSKDPDCNAGQKCISWHAIDGDLRYSCDIVCGDPPERLCPEGFYCADISDGPQNVCSR